MTSAIVYSSRVLGQGMDVAGLTASAIVVESDCQLFNVGVLEAALIVFFGEYSVALNLSTNSRRTPLSKCDFNSRSCGANNSRFAIQFMCETSIGIIQICGPGDGLPGLKLQSTHFTKIRPSVMIVFYGKIQQILCQKFQKSHSN